MVGERKPRSSNKTYYHFVVYLKSGDRMYFYTAQQVADQFNLSRSTVYRALKSNHKLYDFGMIKKDYLHNSVVEHLVRQEKSKG